MRVGIFIIVLAASALCMFCVWYRWGALRNRGSEFGYYGEYNSVSNALASIPDVVVTHGWYNADVSLEEFGFELTQQGHRMRLWFGERDPVRFMPRKDAVVALRRLFDQKFQSDAYPPPKTSLE